jgi:hypothetical protein
LWNPVEAIKIIDSGTDILDSVEEFYERGEGRYEQDYVHLGRRPDYFIMERAVEVPERKEKVCSKGEPILNWKNIYQSDLLYSQPVPLVSELFKHDKMKKMIIDFALFFKG